MKKILNKVHYYFHRFLNYKIGITIGRFPTNELEQRLSLLNCNKIDVILDIGANIGQYAIEMRRSGYKGLIISFEPIEEAYRKLAQKSANDKNWIAYNYAIGDINGESTINISQNLVSSSINQSLEQLEQSEPTAKYIRKEQIHIKTMDTVWDSLGVSNKNIFMKIDTQGYEKQVLDGAAESLKKIKGLQIEMALVPSYHNASTFDQIKQRIEALGFELMAIENGFYDKTSGRQLEVDGIFFKP